MYTNYISFLQKKYEYLDFDNATILECFRAALKEVDKTSSSDAILYLNLEHYFLHNLILEIKKGNDSIKEAILFALEPKHDFFIQKRKDLSSLVPKEEQFACYCTAFDEAIFEYDGDKNFDSLLMSTIIQVYKNYNIKGMVKK